LRRVGKKKQPQYRLVVAEALGPRDGRFIEIIGTYDPRRDPPLITVNEERALEWLRKGAEASDTVRHMLVRVGVWERFTGKAPEARPAGQGSASPEPEATPAPEAVEPEAVPEAEGP
jgi:small subunit ribosomal protein S16